MYNTASVVGGICCAIYGTAIAGPVGGIIGGIIGCIASEFNTKKIVDSLKPDDLEEISRNVI